MAADGYHVSFGFSMNADYKGGWTENFWSRAGDKAMALKMSMKLKDVLIPVHGAQTSLDKLHISKADGTRALITKTFSDVDKSNGLSTEDSDIPNTKAQLKLASGEDYLTTQWIGGIPDSAVQKGKLVQDKDFLKAAKKLFAHLADDGNLWGMRVLDGNNEFGVIHNITNTGIVTIPGHGLANGDRVLISKVPDIADANGEWDIENVTADTFSLKNWGAAHAGPEAVQEGRAKKQNLIMVGITEAMFAKASSHKVGRPSDLSTGRRKSR